MHKSSKKRPAMLLAVVLVLLGTSFAGNRSGSNLLNPRHSMSAMGRAAYQAVLKSNAGNVAGRTFNLTVVEKELDPDGGDPDEFENFCVPDFDVNCDHGEDENPAGGQAETSIAVDATGRHIVIGFNDTRGFNLTPFALSGVLYSDDGGATFTDGGQLPNGPTSTAAGNVALPQVFGDPDVKYVPGGAGCQFVYASIGVVGFGTPVNNVYPFSVQTLVVHRSTDCGHTWQGPFEVTSATNPTGILRANGSPRDAADKEQMDVDPKTGRVIITWSNFTTTAVAPGGTQISATYSDDIMSGNPPTWTTPKVLNAGSTFSDQAAFPRFDAHSNNVYVSWSRRASPVSGTGFARSTDNGQTWEPLVDLVPLNNLFGFPSHLYFNMDQVLGNDRVHQFPSLAVDNSSGPNSGKLYVVYANNNNQDGADIVLQTSTDGGVTFSDPAPVNGRPGEDRPQWFPFVAVDKDTGRVSIMYYDQGVAPSGDVTETSWLYSDNGGSTWVAPSPLTDRPFHAGYGNDTGQPNLGDYNGMVAQDGKIYVSYAWNPNRVLFTDGQPSTQMTFPDVQFRKASLGKAAIALAGTTFSDSGGNGFADAGDILKYTLTLRNMVTNAAFGATSYITGGILSSTTPGVTVLQPVAIYGRIDPGAAVNNGFPFLVRIAPSFTPGTPIEFSLRVITTKGSNTLLFTQPTGTPVNTTLIAENFDGGSALPTGWVAAHGAGPNTVPWVINNTFCGITSNGLFHQNANDAPTPTGNQARFERAFSPIFTVPANAVDVTVDFDTCYDTEDDPNFNIQAFDGYFLRVTDQTGTPQRPLRSVLAEAFATYIKTGDAFHYPKHFPRNSNPNYFEDMSAWAGDSGGFKHVSMSLPGMQDGKAQLRFEFAQDDNSICTDVRPTHTTCGVILDNVVVRAVSYTSNELAKIVLSKVRRKNGVYTGVVIAQPNAPAGGIVVQLSSSNPSKTTLPNSITIPAGSQTSAPFEITVARGVAVTITATGPSNSRSAKIRSDGECENDD